MVGPRSASGDEKAEVARLVNFLCKCSLLRPSGTPAALPGEYWHYFTGLRTRGEARVLEVELSIRTQHAEHVGDRWNCPSSLTPTGGPSWTVRELDGGAYSSPNPGASI